MESSRQQHFRELAARHLPCDDDEDHGEPGRYLLVRRRHDEARSWLVTFPDRCFVMPYIRRHAWERWSTIALYDLETGRAIALGTASLERSA